MAKGKSGKKSQAQSRVRGQRRGALRLGGRARQADERTAARGEEMEQEQPESELRDEGEARFSIVGGGASAGGLEAFTQVLKALPGDTEMAIVLVQHLSPTHQSVLPELLSGSTSLPVEQVSEGTQIKPNHIYVMPPNVHMGIEQGRLHLTPRPHDRTQHTPIDTFLRSLAEYAQGRAIGVILSGTASDGSAGLKYIKAGGGVTMGPSPGKAKY